jgi:hypothetical protein
MLTMLTLTAILAGAVLGLRFKVLVLVPAIAISSAATIGAGIAQNNTAWPVLLGLALVISALQIGYFSGAFIQLLRVAARARNEAPGVVVAAQRSGH